MSCFFAETTSFRIADNGTYNSQPACVGTGIPSGSEAAISTFKEFHSGPKVASLFCESLEDFDPSEPPLSAQEILARNHADREVHRGLRRDRRRSSKRDIDSRNEEQPDPTLTAPSLGDSKPRPALSASEPRWSHGSNCGEGSFYADNADNGCMGSGFVGAV